ncbi:peptidase S8/S53 domain-containing protein [Stachybotrys elegans]|uniref:Peptidase S8/S53 domain-containing protein n=1 Tax=Stachybotrys elegans TaxID=80388 RepID=A0A8K0WRX9_9HYPO|nr:peptidase S8/S53 domain-containing protein [Stachybotrys elegans]
MLKFDRHRLTPYNKLVLGMNLARMLLRMYGAGMDGCSWSAEDLFFLCDSSQQTAYEIYNPYLNYSLTGTGKPIAATPPDKFPILVAFARLLLEIARGKILGPLERSPDRPHNALRAELDRDEICEEMVEEYVNAIKSCLKAKKNDKDANGEEEECRAVIREVVVCLEGAWRTRYAVRRDPNTPKEFKLSRDGMERQARSAQNGASRVPQEQPLAAIRTETASPSGCLFDVSRKTFPEGGTDERCTWAKDFLARARDFYTNHIYGLPSEKRVKVAVLDTGIDGENPILKSAKRERRRNDWPIKDQRSFLDGVSVTDTDGHGTNVAALVLKMTPEADLYVAKISECHEVVGTDHIAEAVRWAIGLHVNIINMSFGLYDDSEEIRRAIEDAAAEGIICAVHPRGRWTRQQERTES